MDRALTLQGLERLGQWLAEHPTGCARLLFTDDVAAATSVTMELAQTTGSVVLRVITEPLPRDVLTLRLVETLAESARARWPEWYGRSFSHNGTLEDELSASSEIAAVIEEHGEVLSRWLSDACSRVRRGGLPFFVDRPLGLQARQLALAIDTIGLRVIVVWSTVDLHDAALDGVARTLAWIAGETGARVTGVMGTEFEGRNALDRIGYGSTGLRFATADVERTSTSTAAIVRPVIGRPHPLSRAEQRLAQVLAKAVDLRSLFEFNQRIETARGAHAIVDLIWRSGRVIVEIDGWDTHGNRGAFASDRHRDYELVVSGYVVLRLTNDEILQDAAKAVDKIRDVVVFRHSEKGTR